MKCYKSLLVFQDYTKPKTHKFCYNKILKGQTLSDHAAAFYGLCESEKLAYECHMFWQDQAQEWVCGSCDYLIRVKWGFL